MYLRINILISTYAYTNTHTYYTHMLIVLMNVYYHEKVFTYNAKNAWKRRSKLYLPLLLGHYGFKEHCNYKQCQRDQGK